MEPTPNEAHRAPGNQVAISLPPTLITASILTAAFYGILAAGWLPVAWIHRYATCHAVAYATVFLFVIVLVHLIRKSLYLTQQRHALERGSVAIGKIVASYGDSSRDIPPRFWLQQLWITQKQSILQSWLGNRISQLLDRQSKRPEGQGVEQDLRDLSDADHDQLHDSYALLRIAFWAMPMLGFLGTVLGISETLGQMDMEKLSSGSQEALNAMTSGLYVAFDTTAIALALTMVGMFLQYAVQQSETRCLQTIDRSCQHHLMGWLDGQKEVSHPDIRHVAEQMANQLSKALLQATAHQADFWQNSIEQAKERWTGGAQATSDLLRAQLDSSLHNNLSQLHQHFIQLQQATSQRWVEQQDAMEKVMREPLERLADCMKAMEQQTQRMIQLADRSSQLEERTGQLAQHSTHLEQLDQSMQQTLKRLVDVDRFHEAAMAMTEAVSFLSSQLERYGKVDSAADSTNNSPSPNVLPMTPRRRAA
ncbi:MAG: MotA/TolQ/ExbB proton channel family protein [Pirellulaceae bacterium]